jgi:hypothetical protein
LMIKVWQVARQIQQEQWMHKSRIRE